MSARLNLGDGVRLPLEAVTETIALVGIRGSGKTVTASVIAEELLEAGQQVVVIDPTDVWWGLKSSADGKRPGYPVVILGGRHGDLPLNATDGATIADFIVEERASVILAVRHFESRNDQRRFVTDVCNRLYHRKGEPSRETPLMLMIDEASLFVPQRVTGEEAKCVAAIQRLVRQGRASGFGVTLIDQRPATVNKDVLTQLELLVCHRISSPQDRKALEAWIEQHDAHGRAKEFLAGLASLPQGTAWLWSPGWLDLFRRTEIRDRRTFDSSRTPKAGERIVAPAKVAEIDLDALKGKLAASIERAKADDPKALRARIRELEATSRKPAPPVDDGRTIRELEAATKPLVTALSSLKFLAAMQLNELGVCLAEAEQAMGSTFAGLRRALSDKRAQIDRLREPATFSRVATVNVGSTLAGTFHAAAVAPPGPQRPAIEGNGGAHVSRPQQRMLDALRAFEQVGVERLTMGQLAVFSDQSPKSSGFEKNCSTLRTAGLIDYPVPKTARLTDAGRALARDDGPPATLNALHQAWQAKLSGPQQRMLAVLVEHYPRLVSRAELAGRSNQSISSSGWEKNLSTMRSLGILDYPDAHSAVATELLFPAGLT